MINYTRLTLRFLALLFCASLCAQSSDLKTQRPNLEFLLQISPQNQKIDHRFNLSQDFIGQSQNRFLRIQSSGFEIKNGKIIFRNLYLGLELTHWSFRKGSLLNIECQEVRVHLIRPLFQLEIPDHLIFVLQKKINSPEITLDLQDESRDLLVESFLRSLKNDLAHPKNLEPFFGVSALCSKRVTQKIKELTLSYLKTWVQESSHWEEVRQALESALSQGFNKYLKNKTLAWLPWDESFEKEIILDLKSLDGAIIARTKTLSLSPIEEQKLKKLQKNSIQQQLSLLFLPLGSFQLLTEKILQSKALEKTGLYSGASGMIHYRIPLNWSVENLRLQNPLFENLDPLIHFDVELSSQNHLGQSQLPSLRPFKSQGGLRKGIELEVPITAKYINRENEQSLGSQYLGILRAQLDLRKDSLNLVFAEINQDEDLEVELVPSAWIDALSWTLQDTERLKKLNAQISKGLDSLSDQERKLFENLNFLIVPDITRKRDQNQEGYYASGIFTQIEF